MQKIKKVISGLIVCIIIGILAYYLGKLVPIVGGPVFAIIIGIIIGNTLSLPEKYIEGIKFTSKKILQWAIIVLGGSLGLNEVFRTGVDSLGVMLGTMSIAFISAFFINKKFKIGFNMTALISSGTAVCGGSAIAAVGPAIGADDSEIAYSVSVIFLFNVLAALIFPILGHLMQMPDLQFGLWAGTAVNDTSSVVAAAFSYSDVAGNYAVIVKLTRTLMIIPIAFAFAFIASRRGKSNISDGEIADNEHRGSLWQNFPIFILGFLAMSLVNTVGLFPPYVAEFFSFMGKFMITVAMAAIGLNTNFRKIIKSGIKPILMGFILWVILGIASLIMINWG